MKIIKKISLLAMLLGSMHGAHAGQNDPQDEKLYDWQLADDANYLYTKSIAKTEFIGDGFTVEDSEPTPEITRDLFGRIIKRTITTKNQSDAYLVTVIETWEPKNYSSLFTAKNAGIAAAGVGAAAIGAAGLYASGLFSGPAENTVSDDLMTKAQNLVDELVLFSEKLMIRDYMNGTTANINEKDRIAMEKLSKNIENIRKQLNPEQDQYLKEYMKNKSEILIEGMIAMSLKNAMKKRV